MFGPDGPFFDNLPQNLKANKTGMYMILETLTKLLEEWICDGKKDFFNEESN